MGLMAMAKDIYDRTRIVKPSTRPLRVYAFDPGAGRFVGNEMVATVPYEKLEPGPVGARFAVVDYDYEQKVYYKAVDLDHPWIVMRRGLDPTEGDPRFHQQMVYAVACETLQRFEVALGRRLHWFDFEYAERDGSKPPARAAVTKKDGAEEPQAEKPNRLLLFPHAMADANAFYSRAARGILFGYFRASETDPGRNLPGQTVYTCLSHDIIAHETTHAILDGMRHYFTEPTNIDVPAFHEAFADLAALFSHFSHKEVLLDTLAKTGGRLYDATLSAEASAGSDKKKDGDAGDGKDAAQIQSEIAAINPLVQLAQQFGEASGMQRGLRQMLGTRPNSNDINVLVEPHDRGAILVAAVFDAYFTIYSRRTADLFRIYRDGGGQANPVDLPEALASRLAKEASRTAEEFFSICARAIDYCPPVDIEFGDFLRAVVTAHADFYPADPDGVRAAFVEAFRLRGILPKGASSLTESSLCWPQVADNALPPVVGLQFGDPNGLTRKEKDDNGRILRTYAADHAAKLGFDPRRGAIKAPSFHPIFRIGPHGDLITDMVVELVQTEIVTDDAGTGPYPFRSGVTLLIWQEFLHNGKRADPKIHYVIQKLRTAARQQRQSEHFAAMPRTGRQDEHRHRPGDDGAIDEKKVAAAWQIDFGVMHLGV